MAASPGRAVGCGCACRCRDGGSVVAVMGLVGVVALDALVL